MLRFRGQEETTDRTGPIPLRSWPRDPQGLETPDPGVTGAGRRQAGVTTYLQDPALEADGVRGSCPQSPCLGGTARGQQAPRRQSGDQAGPAQGSLSGL